MKKKYIICLLITSFPCLASFEQSMYAPMERVLNRATLIVHVKLTEFERQISEESELESQLYWPVEIHSIDADVVTNLYGQSKQVSIKCKHIKYYTPYIVEIVGSGIETSMSENKEYVFFLKEESSSSYKLLRAEELKTLPEIKKIISKNESALSAVRTSVEAILDDDFKAWQKTASRSWTEGNTNEQLVSMFNETVVWFGQFGDVSISDFTFRVEPDSNTRKRKQDYVMVSFGLSSGRKLTLLIMVHLEDSQWKRIESPFDEAYIQDE